jgi:protein SCO1
MTTTAALAAALAVAQADPAYRPPAPPSDPAATVQPMPAPVIPDDVLLDQDGNQVKLSELLKGKTVAMSFVYTTCSTICSPMTAILARVQEHVGEHLGRDVVFVSVTLDPKTDTPTRLREFSDKFGRKPGWSFLTGPRERAIRVQRAFGSYYPDRSSHTPTLIVGNQTTGVWFGVSGFSSPKWIADQLIRVQQGGQTPRTRTAAAAAARN